MAHLAIRLLGAFQASIEGRPIRKFESMKVRALLAYLAVERSQPQSREYLMSLFWPEMSPKRASSNLSQALYNLTKRLQNGDAEQPYLLRTYESVQFNPKSDFWLDVEVFERQFDQASKDGHKTALSEALELYQGDFLAGFGLDGSPVFDEWLLIERHRLQRKAFLGLGKLAQRYAQDGDMDAALRYAWRQVDLDPLNEPATRQLMRLLEECGQRSQALAQFERLQVLLSEELDIQPEQETVALRDQIRGQAPIAGLSAQRRDNLPAFLTSLVGRQRELAELQEQLSSPDCRLLTILGPGGSGKSRLALEVARSMGDSFPQGLVFVPLNPVQSVDWILGAVLETLDLTPIEQDDPADQLINYLRGKQILLVLDGFEHLLAGSALVMKLLKEAGGFKLLVTSRMRLNLKGEYLYPLNGMSYPAEGASLAEVKDSDAVQLLIQTLRHADPGYQPAASDFVQLRQICQQVLGMPLGILLAASWGGTLTVEEIAGMVGKSLDLMAASWDDLPARQRSLRATFDYTWNLLSKRLQSIFQSISVFRGDFTRRAAQVVCEATPYELRELIDRSLLLQQSPGRYEVHELLRQYGRQVLGQNCEVEAQVCRRHSEYYLGQLSRLGIALKGAEQPGALANIDHDHENYRAAWNWASVQGAADLLYPAVEALCLYYELSVRFSDGESACREALTTLSKNGNQDDILLETILLAWSSRFNRLLGQAFESRRLLDQAQIQFKNFSDNELTRWVGAFLTIEEGNNHFQTDRMTAATFYLESLHKFREAKDDLGIARSLARLGLIAHHAGSFEDALKRYGECLEIYREMGEPRGIANSLIELGHNTLRQGQVDQGHQYIQEGTEILQKIGDRAGIARAYFELGRSFFWEGQFEKSYHLMSQSVPIFEELGIRERLVFTTVALSLGLSHMGRYREAIAQVEKGLPIARELGARREIAMAYLLLGKARLGMREYKQAINDLHQSFAKYQEIDQKDELSWVMALTYLAQQRVDRTNADFEIILQVLHNGIEIQGYYPILCILCGIVLYFLEYGKIERAVELAALLWSYPIVASSQWFQDIAGQEIAAAIGNISSEVASTLQKQGRARDLWETARELLEEFKNPVKLHAMS